MKAITHTRYGPPQVLRIQEIEKPKPKHNEVLVKVMACTVNRTDCANLTAKPFIMRFTNGLLSPGNPIPGTDFAGIIEECGPNVKNFKTGDTIFGFDDRGTSSYAEYLVIQVKKGIAKIPKNINFEQAAASIEGFHYAYNFVNKVNLKPGQKVLINGATGAIGSAALQIVKTYGCDITAVCGSEHLKQTRVLGANRVIDYFKDDFTQQMEKYDFVFDTVGKSSFGKCKPILKKHGTYISSELGYFAQNLYFALSTKIIGKKNVLFPLPVNIQESIFLVQKLLLEKKFTPLIDRTYNMEEVIDAFEYVLKGQKIGNVILRISE